MRADYGRRLYVVFDRELDPGSVRAQDFFLTDADGTVFVPFTAATAQNGFAVRLDFSDFNGAYGTCAVRYVPGQLRSVAGEDAEEDIFAFLPVFLSGNGGGER